MKALRAATGGDQITRLRQSCFGLALIYCLTQTLSALATSRPPAERGAVMLGIVLLLAAYVGGYRRGSFPLGLRLVILAIILGLAPLLGSAIVGAAFTAIWLTSLYQGGRPAVIAVGLSVAALMGEISQASGTTPVNPGNLVGETMSLLIIAFILSQLRTSLIERDELKEVLTQQALHDLLTDLPNRRAFHARLDSAVERYRSKGEPYAVLMVDLDDFKRINDTYGHSHGDRMLLTVAQRAAECVRTSDTCARLGGDEFAIVVQGCWDLRTAEQLAIRIEQAICRPVELDGIVEQIGASVGVTWSGETADMALRDADRAMYAAKARSKAPLDTRAESSSL